MKWDTVSTPNSVIGRYDVLNPEDPSTILGPWGSELQDIAVGQNERVLAVIARTLYQDQAHAVNVVSNVLFYSNSSGISFTLSKQTALDRNTNWFTAPFNSSDRRNLYHVVIAPDDPNLIAVTSDDTVGGVGGGPRSIWITADGGANWDQVMNDGFLSAGETIRALDISIAYGSKRDMAVATYTGGFGGRLFTRSTAGFQDWQAQLLPAATVDYHAVKFSPSYNSDSAVAVVYCSGLATYYNVGLRDLSQNQVLEWAFGSPGIEVRDPAGAADSSPDTTTLIKADLELPTDFSGQSASLRRAYISLDASVKNSSNRTGIYRIDDATTYMLMDTTSVAAKNIYSIAYYGTYSSGKLLAGERNGFPCTATVPTWFTDSPTTCPVPCWYPALKPTTGAANQGTCASGSQDGVGAAIVAWNASASLALVITGSNAVSSGAMWYQGWLEAPKPNDESAFGISRNNGETWNQLALIDTTIDWFNDVVSSPDCTTLYIASVNRDLSENQTGSGMCDQFDSVWRSTVNINVASPMPAILPIGQYWERVFTHTTSLSCADIQSDLPILRLPTGCNDKPNGEIVGWAAQYTRAQAWSPDYGDFWALITPRDEIQDFCFESSTLIYDVSPAGMVQKLPYTGTSWSTGLPSVDTTLEYAHTITAYPDGNVLVGAGDGSGYVVAFSSDMQNGSPSFRLLGPSALLMGDVHVVFDPEFKENRIFYVNDESEPAPNDTVGSVYRNVTPNELRWVDADMMSTGNNAGGSPWPAWPSPSSNLMKGPPHNDVGHYGIVMAYTGDPQPALYSAHHAVLTTPNATLDRPVANPIFNSAVCRTLQPRGGIPKPGIPWDCLDIFTPLSTSGVLFTLEPTSLKSCGCCSLDSYTTLYAIDNESGGLEALSGRWNGALDGGLGYTPSLNRGMLWAYTDCLAKQAPVLLSPAASAIIGCDPVTGRNQQVDLSWEQLCLATEYYVSIAKDEAFELLVWGDVVTMDDITMLHPSMFLAPGTLPEAGAQYYWRVQVTKSATTQIATSPSSRPRLFKVKPGFIVSTPYYGVMLLSPNNGCDGCKVKPASFSWSPWKEATKYQFELAGDSEFKQMVVSATTSTTGYEYTGTLDYSTNYFWRVKAVEVNGQNIPSDWSATFSFQTEPAPSPEEAPPAQPSTPLWAWIIIAIGTLLLIVVLVLIFKTRRM